MTDTLGHRLTLARLKSTLFLLSIPTLFSVPAESSSIHIKHDEVVGLQEFLKGGPSHWAQSNPPRFPFGLSIVNRDGTLKKDLVVEFLTWKRDLDPTQFDSRHPKIAHLFQAQQEQLASLPLNPVAPLSPSQPTGSSLPVLTPPVTGTISEPPSAVSVQQDQFAAPVPEPSAVFTALALFGLAGGWWRFSRCPRVLEG